MSFRQRRSQPVPSAESKRWRRGVRLGGRRGRAGSWALARRRRRRRVHGALDGFGGSRRCVHRARVGCSRWGGVAFVAASRCSAGCSARHPSGRQPSGLEAASRWLGVRAELAENPVFASHSPLKSSSGSRLLAYGAALGVAAGASRPLPMGASRTRTRGVRSAAAGGAVRISYPASLAARLGCGPGVRCSSALAVAGGLGSRSTTPARRSARRRRVRRRRVLAACIGVVLGVAVVVMAASDWRNEPSR